MFLQSKKVIPPDVSGPFLIEDGDDEHEERRDKRLKAKRKSVEVRTPHSHEQNKSV